MPPARPRRNHELAEAPELAVLHVLDVALVATANALTAAHVELQAVDFVRELAQSQVLEACLADAVLAHVDSLQLALARYRDYLRQRHAPDIALRSHLD